jgi:hypothetical protein
MNASVWIAFDDKCVFMKDIHPLYS